MDVLHAVREGSVEMSQCIGKRRFADEAAALRALETIRSSTEAWLQAKVPCRVYECDVCRDWHLTAQKQDTRKKSRLWLQ